MAITKHAAGIIAANHMDTFTTMKSRAECAERNIRRGIADPAKAVQVADEAVSYQEVADAALDRAYHALREVYGAEAGGLGAAQVGDVRHEGEQALRYMIDAAVRAGSDAAARAYASSAELVASLLATIERHAGMPQLDRKPASEISERLNEAGTAMRPAVKA